MDYLRRIVSVYRIGRPWVDMRPHNDLVTEPAAVTKDGVTAEVRVAMTWQVTNEEAAVKVASVLSEAVSPVMRTAIRAALLRNVWADILFERERIIEDVRSEFAPVEKVWGIALQSFEILEIKRR